MIQRRTQFVSRLLATHTPNVSFATCVDGGTHWSYIQSVYACKFNVNAPARKKMDPSLCTWIVPPCCESQLRIQRSSNTQINSTCGGCHALDGTPSKLKENNVTHCWCSQTDPISSAHPIHITARCKSKQVLESCTRLSCKR